MISRSPIFHLLRVPPSLSASQPASQPNEKGEKNVSGKLIPLCACVRRIPRFPPWTTCGMYVHTKHRFHSPTSLPTSLPLYLPLYLPAYLPTYLPTHQPPHTNSSTILSTPPPLNPPHSTTAPSPPRSAPTPYAQSGRISGTRRACVSHRLHDWCWTTTAACA